MRRQVIAEMQEDPMGIFAIHVGESTDILCKSVCLHRVYKMNSFLRYYFIFCHITKGENIFEAVPILFENEGLSWENMLDVQQFQHLQC